MAILYQDWCVDNLARVALINSGNDHDLPNQILQSGLIAFTIPSMWAFSLWPIVTHATLIRPPSDLVSGDSISDISNKYIVTLVPESSLLEHLNWVEAIHTRDLGQHNGLEFHGLTHFFNISTYQAYAGHFSPAVIAQLANHVDVSSIEPDQHIYLCSSPKLMTQPDAPYGLGLISHRSIGIHQDYTYDSSGGNGTWAYVIDTGIDIYNRDFEGRASHGYVAVRGRPPTDVAGHGTHVAGIIGSKTYGVAKKCELVSVKVLHGPSQGTVADLLEGLDWTVGHILKHGRLSKAVINISLSTPFSSLLNQAIDAVFRAGVLVVVAAGNEGGYAGHVSPASAAGSLSVGATDHMRIRADFSNYGPHVAMFAPGEKIMSTLPGGRAHGPASGTSMAAPFVAGMALYFQGIKTFRDPKSLRQAMTKLALRNEVMDARDSHNLFAFTGGGSRISLLHR